MVLTVSLAGALTRHSVTGNTTAKCNSSGACLPARQDPSRTTQVRGGHWDPGTDKLSLHRGQYHWGRFLVPVNLRGTRSVCSRLQFGVNKVSLPSGVSLEQMLKNAH